MRNEECFVYNGPVENINYEAISRDMSMKSVKDVLNAKGTDIWSIAPDAFVYDAIELMARKEVGALLVQEESRLIGIVSERDYTRKVILKGKSSRQTLVREIMTSELVCAEAD